MLASRPSLFLGITPAQTRAYLHKLFSAARGQYRTVIVPCAGRFSGPLTAIRAGFKPEEVFASDIGLFSTVIGYLATGRDPHTLNITLNLSKPAGIMERFKSTTIPEEYAACALYAIKLATQPSKNTWQRMFTDDLVKGWERHVNKIAAGLKDLAQATKGIHYAVADVFDEVEQHADDPTALLYIDPPGFAGGYTKQFASKGTVTWDAPFIAEFKPAEGFTNLMARLLDKPALAVILRAKKEVAEDKDIAVWGMWDGSKVKCLLSNHPETVRLVLTKGVDLVRKPTKDADPGFPVWGAATDRIRPDSKVQFTWTKREVGLYYRDLFAHTLGDTNTELFALMWLDGKVFGTVGLHMQMARLGRKFKHTDEDDDRLWVFETFGFSSRHRLYPRYLNRLLMTCITCEEFRRFLGGPDKWPLGEPSGIRTACITKGHESKGNRGILKLVHRERREDGRHYLVYQTEWRPGTWADQVKAWCAKYGDEPDKMLEQANAPTGEGANGHAE